MSAVAETSLARGAWIRYGEFMFRHRNGLFPLVLGAVLIGFRPVPAGPSPGDDVWLDLAGLAVALTGQALRVLVVGLAYIKRGGLDKRIYAESLVTTGMFAHCRNPLYVGNLLVLTGLLLMHNSPWVYLIGGGFVLTAYVALVSAEERYLTSEFGAEYVDYCARVPRWVPRLRGLGDTMAAMTFSWRRVLVKEYASAASWIFTAGVLLAYEAWLRAPDNRVGWLAPLGLCAFAFLGALAISLAKRSGRLRAPD